MSYNYSRICTIYNFQLPQHLSKHHKSMCLTSDETRKLCNIYKVKLHNPVQDITLVRSNVKGAEIYCHEGLLYFKGNSSPLSIAVINIKSDPTLNINTGCQRVLEILEMSWNLFLSWNLCWKSLFVLEISRNVLEFYFNIFSFSLVGVNPLIF